MYSPKDILKQYWGYEAFRPLQEDIIQSTLDGKDTLALLPTGAGKSLCYQVPALCKEGFCLVISPLIALMKDQVQQLQQRGIKALSIHSGLKQRQVREILQQAIHDDIKFLYVSPERIETNLFKEYLPSLEINLIAVDEAHCISQWGYDFRPPYLRIAQLRPELKKVPVLALTASATPKVQQDICEKLQFKTPNIFRASFLRPKLSFSVFHEPVKIQKTLSILQKIPGSSIVYCKSRKKTQEIAYLLSLQNITADYYHAGLPHEVRAQKQQDWIDNITRVIVCTNAFGMGIDKPDVRTVIHYDVPDSMEGYYQEAGRAGRDSKKAYAVLLYDDKDTAELQLLPTIRFPDEAAIRHVYRSLVNYLQIPAGSGEFQWYDFDLNSFIKNFQLDQRLAIYSIKALEQELLLSYTEQVFVPARIGFTTNKEELYRFEEAQPILEPLIKALLRNYEGIFDQSVTVVESYIARITRRDINIVKQQLQYLHQQDIIDYQPVIDTPQVRLLQPRLRVDDLKINQVQYQLRKKEFEERIQTMIHYLQQKSDCRSLIMTRYFGDLANIPCGICDVCLNKRQEPVTKEEFSLIHHSIAVQLKTPLTLEELLLALPAVPAWKVRQVVTFLLQEEKLSSNDAGKLSTLPA